MAKHDRTLLIELGVAVTLQRWENDASRMCGDISRQTIVYKSAGHLPDVRLASGEDLWSRPTLWNRPAICRSSGVLCPEIGLARQMIVRLSPDDWTIFGDIGWFHSWLGYALSRPISPMFGWVSPDYLPMLLRLKQWGGCRKKFNLARRCTDYRLETLMTGWHTR